MKLWKIFILVILLLLTIFLLLPTETRENLVLKLTRYWGYTTLENNPLLTSQDKDLKAVSTGPWRIDQNDFLSGGPAKDGIPALEHPKTVLISESEFSDETLVVGVKVGNEARAYPYPILNWHEIVNDTLAETPITVTLCPLCDTIPVFLRTINGVETTFGVSGKLFQSCLVMYDRATDSLYSQPWGIGIAGENANLELERVPGHKTTLGAWKKANPQSSILTTETGHSRNYNRDPYGTYSTDTQLIFPVRDQENLTLHPKTIVTYITKANDKKPFNQWGGDVVAYSNNSVKEAGEITTEYGDRTITVRYDSSLDSVRFFSEETEIPASTAYAFIIPAFFPSLSETLR